MATVIGILSGLLLILIGVAFVVKHYGLRYRCRERVPGTVISMHEEISQNGAKYFFPVFTYQVSGHEFSQKINATTTYQRYEVSDTVTIRCNPNKPAEFYVEGDLASVHGGFAFVVFGLLLIIPSWLHMRGVF